jgi:hypothetical protein
VLGGEGATMLARALLAFWMTAGGLVVGGTTLQA